MAKLHPDLDYEEDQHEVRLMVGDPQAVAFEWIRRYAENLNSRLDDDDTRYDGEVTAEELIEIGTEHATDSNSWNYISRGGAFEGTSVDPLFWDKLAILKGIEIPQENRNSFFSCSC